MIENSLSFKQEVILRRVASILTGRSEFVVRENWDMSRPNGEFLRMEAVLGDGSDWRIDLVTRDESLVWFGLRHRSIEGNMIEKVEEAIAVILALKYRRHAKRLICTGGCDKIYEIGELDGYGPTHFREGVCPKCQPALEGRKA